MRLSRNRIRAAACAATAALCVFAAPALAQDAPLGSRLAQPQKMHNASADSRAVIVGHSFAACMVRKRESMARRFLDAATVVEATSASTALFREVGCTNFAGMSGIEDGASVASSTDIWRGFLAEELLKRMPPFTLQPLPRVQDYHSVWLDVSGRHPVVEEMAVCVAATNPAGIVSLLATTPESGEELAAMRSLSPSFGPCLQVDAKLTANRQSMRAALAEAIYHRVTAPDLSAQK